MDRTLKNLPFSLVGLIFAGLSIPLAFARHLVSLSLVLAILALILGLWGRAKAKRHVLRYTPQSVARAGWSLRLGAVGALFALLMWVLWRTNVLLG